MKHIYLNHIRADIPWADVDSAYLVYNLQKSDKNVLPCDENETHVEKQDEQTVLRFCHPEETFAENIRTYIQTILQTLKCHMDVQ